MQCECSANSMLVQCDFSATQCEFGATVRLQCDFRANFMRNFMQMANITNKMDQNGFYSPQPPFSIPSQPALTAKIIKNCKIPSIGNNSKASLRASG